MSPEAESSAVELGAGGGAHEGARVEDAGVGKGAPLFNKLAGSWISTWVVLVSLSALAGSFLVMLDRGQRGFFVPVLAVAICVLAALFDAFTNRIPNRLTYTAILAGLILNLAAFALAALGQRGFSAAHGAAVWLGAPGLMQSLLALALCVPLTLAALFFRIGGGDLKLLVGLGTLLGISELGYVAMLAMTMALVYGVCNLLAAGRLNRVLKMAALRGLELFFLKRLPPDDSEHLPGSHVPMAVPLAVGLILSLVMPVGILQGVVR